MNIAHYRIVAKIGEGGMGEVWRATDTKLNRDVAIKILPEAFACDPDRMMRFTREAQVLASLNHPNIAVIHGVEERALVMELVEGPTLAERIAEGRVPVEEALGIARQIVDALEYAHGKGVVHRDLKPANIKLRPDGQVKVLDFGLAKALSNDSGTNDPTTSPTLTMRATQAGVIMGTAAYMAPEQARGQNVDQRADVWSFGVVLYEMLTGRHTFGGETVSDTLASVLKSDPDWSALPAETPGPVRRLLRRCLERDRKKRLRDIGDARLEIDEPAEAPAAVAAAAATSRRGLRWWNALLAAIAMAGAAVAVLHFREAPPSPLAVRFQVAAPEKGGFPGNGGMALSPDGTRLAYIAADAEGTSMLWVRPLDSVSAQALPGTEGVSFLPFWSPDGHFIGFGAEGRLKKIDVSGAYGASPPQTLCEAGDNILGGSWSRDGVIIFSKVSSGILRVPQAGGVPVSVTGPEPGQNPIRPWFLPDGKHFLYVNRAGDHRAIFAASLDGKERKRLVEARQAGAYAAPAPGSKAGHLLFLREATLMAQPLDVERLELTGEPFPVAERVGAYLGLPFFTVSANGVLAWRSGGPGDRYKAVWFDRAGKAEETLGPGGIFSGGLALSPDGKRLAVAQTDQGGNRDIWIVDIARGIPTRFTFDPAIDTGPHWSPDGSRVAFTSDRGSADIFDIYQKDSSGSGTEQLLLKGGTVDDWSPDGRLLLYSVADLKAKYDLWTFALSDRKRTPYLQTPFNERQGQFSPDGRWIAYISDESGQYQVYVQSFPTGAGKFQISTGKGGAQPRWRRDGKEIFYLAPDGRLMAVDVKTAPRFEAGAPKALVDARMPPSALGPVWFYYDISPDGRRFLITTAGDGAAQSAPSMPINVVVNWQSDLKK